ncbi:MAG: hypothetical protein LBI10_07655 [Deltaproteobacteria bacterium]|jgi:hypothetical protein|nr:hypothetical protein [Deltaproteobacteria bacterium]
MKTYPPLALSLVLVVLLGSFSIMGTNSQILATLADPNKAPILNPKVKTIAQKLDAQIELPVFQPLPPAPSKSNFLLPVVVKFLFVLAIGFIAFIGARVLYGHLSRAKTKPQDLGPTLVPANQMAKKLDQIGRDSQELAAKGLYALAIHELLLRSLKEFQKWRRLVFPAAATSREILANLGLGPPIAPALAFLVGQVEVSHFGDANPGAPEYEACLARYEALVAALKGGAKG